MAGFLSGVVHFERIRIEKSIAVYPLQEERFDLPGFLSAADTAWNGDFPADYLMRRKNRIMQPDFLQHRIIHDISLRKVCFRKYIRCAVSKQGNSDEKNRKKNIFRLAIR